MENIAARSLRKCLATSGAWLLPWWAATRSMSAYCPANPPARSTASRAARNAASSLAPAGPSGSMRSNTLR